MKSLLLKTVDSVNNVNNTAAQALGAAQVLDPNVKIESAVDETMGIIKAAATTAALGAGSGVTSTIGSPTVSRVLCDKIAGRCYGLPKDVAGEISSIFDRIVWNNLAGFMTMQVAKATVWGGTFFVSFLTFGAPAPVLTASALMEAPSAARLVIKCAIDLIIILDCAFGDGLKVRALVDDPNVKQRVLDICRRYRTEKLLGGSYKGKTRRRAVHREVNKAIPLITRQGVLMYVGQKLQQERAKVRGIIQKYRFHEAEAMDDGSSVADSDETLLDEDKEDMLEIPDILALG